MHYVILLWNKEKLQYDIVHYSHDAEDMETKMKEYPESKGYKHMIEIRWLKSHDIMLKVAELRRKANA